MLVDGGCGKERAAQLDLFLGGLVAAQPHGNQPKRKTSGQRRQHFTSFPILEETKRIDEKKIEGRRAAQLNSFVGGYRRLQAAGNQPTKKTSELRNKLLFVDGWN